MVPHHSLKFEGLKFEERVICQSRLKQAHYYGFKFIDSIVWWTDEHDRESEDQVIGRKPLK
jgi:hypothetical protein